MANTLIGLIPQINTSLDRVSRELTGLIPSVSMDPSFEQAAVGQTVRSPVTPSAQASDIIPGVNSPDNGDQVIGSEEMLITKSRGVPIRWNGEQTRGLNNSGVGRDRILVDQFTQAFRTLTNEIEADLAALNIHASRAYGTAGARPFGTPGDFTDASEAAKILKDNGAPTIGNQLVINTSAGVNMIGMQSRTDIAGQDLMLRQGVIQDTAGFSIRESAQINRFGSNAIAGVVTVTANTVKGQSTINLTTAAGAQVSGVAGDIIKFSGDSNGYILASDVSIAASSTGDVVINAPGLMMPIAASSSVSGVSESDRNMAFSPSAIVLATRIPASVEGDMAKERRVVTDPVSGLSFEISLYGQYRQERYEVAIAWGVKAVKPEHIALLIG